MSRLYAWAQRRWARETNQLGCIGCGCGCGPYVGLAVAALGSAGWLTWSVLT